MESQETHACVCVSRSVLVPGDAHKEGTAGVCVCARTGGAEGQRSHPPSRCCTLKPNCVSAHLGVCDKCKQQQTVFLLAVF